MNKIISVRPSDVSLANCFRAVPPLLAQTKSEFHDDFDNKGSHPDITLNVGNDRVYAHRLMLRDNAVFNQLFQRNPAKDLTLDSPDSAAFFKYVEYFYRNEIKFDSAKQAVLIADVARAFQDAPLALRLDDTLTHTLNAAYLMDNPPVAHGLAEILRPLRQTLPRLCRAVETCINGAASRAEYLKEPWRYPLSTFPSSGPMWKEDKFQPTAVLKNTCFPIKVGNDIVHLETTNHKGLNITGLIRYSDGNRFSIPLDCKSVDEVSLRRTSSATYYLITHGERNQQKLTCINASREISEEWELKNYLRLGDRNVLLVTGPSTREDTLVGHNGSALLFFKWDGSVVEQKTPQGEDLSICQISYSEEFPGEILMVTQLRNRDTRDLQSCNLQGDQFRRLEWTPQSYLKFHNATEYFENGTQIWSSCLFYSPLGEQFGEGDVCHGNKDQIYRIPGTRSTPSTPHHVATLPQRAFYYNEDVYISSEGTFYHVSPAYVCAYSPLTDKLAVSPRIGDVRDLGVSIVDGALMISDTDGATTVYGPNPLEAKENSPDPLSLDHDLKGNNHE